MENPILKVTEHYKKNMLQAAGHQDFKHQDFKQNYDVLAWQAQVWAGQEAP